VIYTTQGRYSGNSMSVWQIPASPWPGYEMNMEIKSIDSNMAGLREDAKRAILDEPKGKSDGKNNASGTGASGSGTAEKPKGFWGNVGAKLSNAWQATKDTVSGVFTSPDTVGGGREIAQVGKGTGGDINSIPKPSGNGSWAALKDTIMAAAKAAGVDGRMMATIAAIESGFNYTVKAASSSATGLFQFVKDTWNTMLKKYGSKYGIDPNTPPTDPRANALMGAEFIKENAAALQGAVKRPLADTDLYMAHFLGAGGAKKFLSADPKTIAANLMPEAARANPSIFYDASGKPRTVAEVYAVMNNKVRTKGKQFGIDAGGEEIVTNKPATPSTTTASNTAPATQAKAAAQAAPAPSSAATPAPSSGAPAPTSSSGNPLGIPVTDAAPAATPPSNAPKAAPASTPAPTPAQAKQPTVQQDVAALGAGYNMASPRSRDLAAQRDYQKDIQAEMLGNLDTTLKTSHKVHAESRDLLVEIRDLIKARNGTPAKAEAAQPATENKAPVTRSAPRPAQPVSNAPVSMTKGSF
jgi:hypothetical protein